MHYVSVCLVYFRSNTVVSFLSWSKQSMRRRPLFTIQLCFTLQWRRKVVKSEEARTSEARRAEEGSEVLGGGQLAPPPHQLGISGSAVSSPANGVRCEAPTEIDFCVFLMPQKASTTFFGHNRNVTS